MSQDDLSVVLNHAGIQLQQFQVRLMIQGGGAIIPGPVFPPIPLHDGSRLESRRVETIQGPMTALYLRQ